MNKPFAETAEENKHVVFPHIQPLLAETDYALEIASGTGQQICYFAEQSPQVVWQASDLAANLTGINRWINDAALVNLKPAIELDVAFPDWSVPPLRFVYTSNSLHIMSWGHVEHLFARLETAMLSGGVFVVYGPFRFFGEHISESNDRFDAYLKQRDPASGVRDLADLDALGEQHGLQRVNTIALPHNNHLLIWNKI